MLTGALITAVMMAPEEFLVDQLKEAISQYDEAYKGNTSENDRKKIFERALLFPCLMILIKCTGGNPASLIQEIERIKNMRNLYDFNKG